MKTLNIWLWLCGGGFFVGTFFVKPRSQAPTFFVVGLLFIGAGFLFHHLSTKQSKSEKIQAKPFNEWTEAEKEYMVNQIKMYYRAGKLTSMQYDVLYAKYTGTKSMADIYGLDVAMAANRKLDAERAIDAHNKKVERNIITSAAVGSAIGGLGGEAVGIASAVSQGAQESQKLANDLENANKALEQAIRGK